MASKALLIQKGASKTENDIKFDGLSLALIVVSFLISMYLLTRGVNELGDAADLIFRQTLFTINIGILGILLAGATTGRLPKIDNVLTYKESSEITIYFITGLVVVVGIQAVVTNLLVPSSLLSIAETAVGKALLGTIAIYEELFFRYFLLRAIEVSTGNSWVSIIVSSIVFVAYHLAVYGARPDLLLWVGLAGLALGYITVRTRRITPALLVHAGVNLL